MELVPGTSKIIRSPSLKRGNKQLDKISDRVKLEKVLGVTLSSNSAIASEPNSGLVAYPAGCTVVLFSIHNGQQSHIINNCRKTISALAFSSCGRYLATGECGHQPSVRIWDLQGDPQAGPGGVAPQPAQVAELQAHTFGVNCVAFSPNGKYVVSVGSQHDMIVSVWDWRNNTKVASNKVSTKMKAVSFAENGSYFVTVGNRHVKFWYLEHSRSSRYQEAVPLMGRSAILGEQRNNYFCDVACGRGDSGDSTFAITRSGLLCEFNNRRLLDKWVELGTPRANCMAIGERYVFVGCADGIVRCFDPATLRYITTLPRTHCLGVDVSHGLTIGHISSYPANAKYPDCSAVAYDEANSKLTCVYNDHSVYVWDVQNIKRVGKSYSFLYHSACIWGVEMAPRGSPMPVGAFLTCSSDDTIRVWSLDDHQHHHQQQQQPPGAGDARQKGIYQRNIYSNDLLKIIYVDKSLTHLKDPNASYNSVGLSDNKSNTKPNHNNNNNNNNNNSNDQATTYDGKNGVRSIKLSADGCELASGDREGNIRIYDTATMQEKLKIEAHDSEVLCLEYTAGSRLRLLASASRDRLIHVFDAAKNYAFLQTLDDHSSSITAVRFLCEGLQMVSCGADKSIIFRRLSETGGEFVRDHNATGKATLYDMEVDAVQKHILIACQDRNVRVYTVQTGKQKKSFKGSPGDDGSLIKIALDRSGIYAATSSTDKTLSVYDYYSGECMATMCGHSELATGLRFTNDCRRLISASGDGCVFVWKVPHDMTVTMQARLSQQAMRQGRPLEPDLLVDQNSREDGAANNFFSPTNLPRWAKKQLFHGEEDVGSPPASLGGLGRGVVEAKGRWAQRVDRGMGFKSVYTEPVMAFPSLQDQRADSDGSKDSSVDSGTESRQYSDLRINFNKNHSASSRKRIHLTDDSALSSLTAHDGDIEDCSSDQEGRGAAPGGGQPLYYPTQSYAGNGSEFTVNAMDVEELRRSQRRSSSTASSKRLALPKLSLPPASVSGSQDSEDDEDDASTPSGDNTDRNPMSMLSVSSESLDQLVDREKYLRSAFESMDQAGEPPAAGQSQGRATSSLSGQHRTSLGLSAGRNAELIQEALQGKAENDRRREELKKRIEETRRKLMSVGFTSSVRPSKSISDLSHHHPAEKDWNDSDSQSVYYTLDSESSLRRSCSLSDLSMSAAMQPKPKLQVSGKLSKSDQKSSRHHSHHHGHHLVNRSASNTLLDRSDSDRDEELFAHRHNGLSPAKAGGQKPRRRFWHSTVNLSVAADSSSEESTSPVPSAAAIAGDLEVAKVKPAVPPRPRSVSMVTPPHPAVPPRRNPPNPAKSSLTNLDSLSWSDIESMDVANNQVFLQLCIDSAEQMIRAIDRLAKLYSRVKTDNSSNNALLARKVLESTIGRASKILQEVAGSDSAAKKLNDLVGTASSSNNNNNNNNSNSSNSNSLVAVLQQCSDTLMSLIDQKLLAGRE